MSFISIGDMRRPQTVDDKRNLKDENLELKKKLLEQQEQTKKLLVRVQRLTNEVSRPKTAQEKANSFKGKEAKEAYDFIDDLKMKISELTKMNSQLRNKLNYFRSLSEVNSKRYYAPAPKPKKNFVKLEPSIVVKTNNFGIMEQDDFDRLDESTVDFLESIKKELVKSQELIEQKEVEIIHLKAEKTNHTEPIQNNEKIEKLELENLDLKEKIKKLETELKLLEMASSHPNKKIKELEQLLQDARDEKALIESEYEKLVITMENQAAEIEKLERQKSDPNSDLQERLKVLEVLVDQLKDENLQLIEENKLLKQEALNRKHGSIPKLNGSFSDADREWIEKLAKNQDLSVELLQQLLNKNNDLDSALEKMDQLRQELNKLRQELDEKDRIIQTLNEEDSVVKETTVIVSNTDSELIEKLQQEISRLKQENERLAAELEDALRKEPIIVTEKIVETKTIESQSMVKLYRNKPLEPGQNVFFIKVKNVNFDRLDQHWAVGKLTCFCTVEFFDFDLAKSRFVESNQPIYNSSFEFLHWTNESLVEYLTSNQVMIRFYGLPFGWEKLGKDPMHYCKEIGHSLIPMNYFLSKTEYNQSVEIYDTETKKIGQVLVDASFLLPIEYTFSQFKKYRSCFNNVVNTSTSNSLIVKIQRCQDLKIQKSFLSFKFYDFEAFLSEEYQGSCPIIHFYKMFDLVVNEDVDRYLKASSLPLVVFNALNDQIYGIAKIPLYSLTTKNIVEGAFDLTNDHGRFVGTVHLSLEFEKPYICYSPHTISKVKLLHFSPIENYLNTLFPADSIRISCINDTSKNQVAQTSINKTLPVIGLEFDFENHTSYSIYFIDENNRDVAKASFSSVMSILPVYSIEKSDLIGKLSLDFK